MRKYIPHPLKKELQTMYRTVKNSKRKKYFDDIIYHYYFTVRYKLENYDIQDSLKFNVNILANLLHLDPSALCKYFKSLTGMNLHRYLKLIKFYRCDSIFKTKSFSVQQMAEFMGYNSVSHFSREYKKLFGRRPQRSKIMYPFKRKMTKFWKRIKDRDYKRGLYNDDELYEINIEKTDNTSPIQESFISTVNNHYN